MPVDINENRVDQAPRAVTVPIAEGVTLPVGRTGTIGPITPSLAPAAATAAAAAVTIIMAALTRTYRDIPNAPQAIVHEMLVTTIEIINPAKSDVPVAMRRSITIITWRIR